MAASMTRTSRSCDEEHDGGSGVFVAEADVVQVAVVAQGDAAGLVDAVVTDAVVGVVAGSPGVALGRAW